MSKATYRKIIVDDVEYHWIAGREATKVQNRITRRMTRIYQNADWATPHIIPDWERLRSAESLGAGLTQDNMVIPYHTPQKTPWIVAPGDVRGMIIGERKWKDHPCSFHPHRVVTGLCYDPFASEIDEKHILRRNCPQCMFESWMNT